ncbi:ParB family chromosome partitioning protein [Sporomusaceae bacterium BoRhaA]|uniref:nucleoid occlusion protein n=1 Tax=Pelorhabdus rhamnosifermentans TaxID=2772457 RepID=UPI001FE4A08E|nr:nucleoid occlusion protein [Pelorhabdus rhamnosifermentans]MBU2703145.1 ParB family chromosome partitioning protein [Pelorhabdus rhamnosifermentans]
MTNINCKIFAGEDVILIKGFAKFLGIGNDKEVEAVVEAFIPNESVSDGANNKVNQAVLEISPDQIIPNPFQPRKTFHDESLQELAESIKEFGVIQPLLVRQVGNNYELIAGERRLRASKLACLTVIPVIVKSLNDKEMAELAMIENLQREDLHFLEEAEGFQQLISHFGLTQENMAQRVGKNQSTIANKLRLLKLSPEVRQLLREHNLTERHARALLKVENEAQQLDVLNTVIENKMNVRETEDYIDNFSREIEKEKTPKQNVVKVIRDVRIFLNSINKVVGEMKKSGLKIKMNQKQDDDFITIQLKIPKKIQATQLQKKKKN